jgi:hypothetical protein
MRFVVAKRNGRRGAGLGNEILPWAKGWIASQVLNARLVGPSWGINQRRYYRNFRTSRLDFLLEDSLLRLPHHTFTEQDFRASGEADFGSALRKWAVERRLSDKRSFVVSVEGMWGGYASIRSAREFLLAKLLNSRDALHNVYEIASALDPGKLFVTVHMRSTGDGFITPASGESVRGKFNMIVPGDWYLWVCSELQSRFRDRIQFRFLTDRRTSHFDEALRMFNPHQTAQDGLTECSDLLLMSQADLRICSVSSYSLTANFLSDGPFVWYEPQLTLNEGRYTLWREGGMQSSTCPRAAKSLDDIHSPISVCDPSGTVKPMFLGTPLNIGDPLPDSLVELLEQRLSCHDPRTNLLGYGSIPQSAARHRSQIHAAAL